MTFKDMYQRSVTLTEREINRITRERILPAYVQAYREINAELRRVYLKLLAGVATKDYYNEMLKYNRYQALIDAVRESYTAAARRAGIAQAQASRLAMSNIFYLRQYALDWINDGLPAFFVLPPELIELSVTGNTEAWKSLSSQIRQRVAEQYGNIANYAPTYGTLTETLLKNRTQDLDRISTALTQSLIQGHGYSRTSSAIRSILNTTANNAKRIARTEGTRLMNAGAFANSQRAKTEGVDIIRVWDATLDSRTRPDHAALDGRREDDNGLFHVGGFSAPYPAHFGAAKQDINCRCSVIDTIDGVDPAVRRGRNPVTGETEVFTYRDFDTWAKDNGLTTNDYGQVYAI